jgi:hypothetical protein
VQWFLHYLSAVAVYISGYGTKYIPCIAPSRSSAAIRGIGAGLLLMRALSGSQGVRSWLNVTDRRPGAQLSPEEARAAWYL